MLCVNQRALFIPILTKKKSAQMDAPSLWLFSLLIFLFYLHFSSKKNSLLFGPKQAPHFLAFDCSAQRDLKGHTVVLPNAGLSCPAFYSPSIIYRINANVLLVAPKNSFTSLVFITCSKTRPWSSTCAMRMTWVFFVASKLSPSAT